MRTTYILHVISTLTNLNDEMHSEIINQKSITSQLLTFYNLNLTYCELGQLNNYVDKPNTI